MTSIHQSSFESLKRLVQRAGVCTGADLTDYCTKTQLYSLSLVTLDNILWRKY